MGDHSFNRFSDILSSQIHSSVCCGFDYVMEIRTNNRNMDSASINGIYHDKFAKGMDIKIHHTVDTDS